MDFQILANIMLVDFPALTTLIASMLFGEEAVILLGFLSGIGMLNIWVLFIFGFVGTLIADIFWFVIGKTVFKERKPQGKLHSHYHRFMAYIDRVAINNIFLALFLTRFFYFFRLFAIIHISRLGMSWKKFLLYEIPLIAIWLTIFVFIGWSFGSVAFELFGNVRKIIIWMVVVLAILLVAKTFIRKKIEKKN